MFRYYIKPKVIPDLLTEDDIEYIKKESINKLSTSTVFNEYDTHCNNINIRDSESMFFKLEDPIINRIIKKCVGLTNKQFIHCEELQIVRYKSGGFYKPHQDVAPIIFGNNSNRRLYTILISLNDDYEGGETSFPNLGIKYKLKKGSALFFHTLDNYELETNMALHSGEPVKSGEKWVCNLWVHKYPYA
jgi:prolyl 4-hydroxylase|tara:strand:+ start:263 stop:829 length:567 start_codon:yes stop_codon:yes gene_type:complete